MTTDDNTGDGSRTGTPPAGPPATVSPATVSPAAVSPAAPSPAAGPAAAGPPAAVPVLSLREPRYRVSRRAIWYWTFRASIGWLVLLAVQLVWLATTGDTSALRLSLLAGTVVLGAAHILIMPQWRYRVHRWETTTEAAYTQAGWLTQNRRIAPVSRIQTVDTERGPLEQLFGLTNITVTTASAAGPLKIEGLDHETAQRLVDELTATAQATAGDAT